MGLLIGTAGHDNLNGSAAAEAYEIQGLAGSDVIYGSAFGDLIIGGPGADQMYGNGGDDTFLITTDTFGDTVNGGAGTDTILGSSGDDVFLILGLSAVEHINGGGGSDVLRGTDAPNFWSLSLTTLVGITAIEGRGGNDQIVATAGNDRVSGGAGNDTLEGGAGTDTAVYSGNFSAYTVTTLASGQLSVSTANGEGTDTLKTFEILEFANGTWANGVFTPFGTPGNTPPVANADVYGATEDSALAVNAAAGVLANDTDVDADALTVSAFDAVSVQGGAVAMNADGSFTYTPAANFSGSDSFSYTAADGRGGTAAAVVTITVAAVNDAPNAVNNSYLATRDTPLVVNATSGVLANDVDPDGDALSVSAFDATSAQGGSVAMNPDGSFTYTPPAGYTGPDSFSYTASDGAAQDLATVNLTVNAPGSGLTLLVGTTSHDSLNVSSASVAYEIQGLAGNDVINGSPFGDLIIGGAGADQMYGNGGDDTFLITTDTFGDTVNGGAGTDTILGSSGDDVFLILGLSAVEHINGGGGSDVLRGTDAPNFWSLSLTTLVGITAIEGRGGNDQIVATAGNDRVSGGAGNDTLEGGAGTDTAVYSGNFSAYTVTTLASGQLSVSTANGEGTDTLKTFEILEFANGTWANGVFTPFGTPGNTPPVANADVYGATEDSALAVNAAAGVLANDTDVDADALTVSAFDAVSVQGGAVAMNADGSFTYTPAANFSGSDSFSYTAADGRGGTAAAVVTITVAAVNDAPNAVNNSYLATRDTPLVVNATSGVLANDVDPDGDALSVSAFDATSAQGGSVAMNPDGSFTYTPPAGYTGPDSFSYTASDGAAQDLATVNLTVNAPGSGLTLLVGTTSHDSLNVSSASVAYEIQGLAGNDVINGSPFGDLIIGGAGADQMYGNGGDDTFLITTDTFGDTVNGGAGTDTILGSSGDDVFLILGLSAVEHINGGGGSDVLRGTDAPNFWSLSLTTLVGITAIEGRGGNDQIVATAGNDRVSGGAGNDTLEGGAGTDTAVYSGNFSAYTVTTLASGQLSVSTANGEGTDTLKTFEILEFANGTWANGIFTLFGAPPNTPPVGNADAYGATEDSALAVNAAAGVLANDTDVDADALTVSAFDAVSVQGGAVAMNADGSFTYTPAANFSGSDSFSYTVSDWRGGFSTASVSLTVIAVNDAPNAVNNSYLAIEGTSLTVNVVRGVLANDTDVDGDSLAVAAFDATSAQGGSVAMNPDGSFTYTPAAGFTGPDSFSYTASDGAAQDLATVVVATTRARTPTPQFDAIIANMAEGKWALVNTNTFQSVWAPQDQIPYVGIGGQPRAIIDAWGSAAWDPYRNEYIFWGGGHANYEGNEVYTWSAVTLQWERASLPSAVVPTPVGLQAIDGYLNAPISSHTYDNQDFLEMADRMITFGGAAAHSGQGFVALDGSRTGPYLWDPSKADQNKVGGTTGSHVKPSEYPDVVGGEMWQNRQTSGPHLQSMVNGTTDYALIDGVDTMFVNDSHRLFKYTIPDVNDPSQDRWETVGVIWDTYSGGGGGAYDPDRNLYVRTSGTEFTFWDLDRAGPTNRNISFVPLEPTGQFQLDVRWGMEYDPVRREFVLWRGAAEIWNLRPPDLAEPGAAGWTIEKAPAPTQPAPPPPGTFTGVNGHWDYLAGHDVFMGVTNPFSGDVWIYKPEGWSPLAG